MEIIDLAGLVTPEIIPLIQDEKKISEYLDLMQADYLITFPGWYSELPDGRTIVYSTGASFSPNAGGENMTVYQWNINE